EALRAGDADRGLHVLAQRLERVRQLPEELHELEGLAELGLGRGLERHLRAPLCQWPRTKASFEVRLTRGNARSARCRAPPGRSTPAGTPRRRRTSRWR